MLIGLAPEADPDGLTDGVIAAAAAEGVITHVVPYESGETSAAAAFLAQIPATVRLQLLTDRLALANGTDPDTVITGAWTAGPLWSAGTPVS